MISEELIIAFCCRMKQAVFFTFTTRLWPRWNSSSTTPVIGISCISAALPAAVLWSLNSLQRHRTTSTDAIGNWFLSAGVGREPTSLTLSYVASSPCSLMTPKVIATSNIARCLNSKVIPILFQTVAASNLRWLLDSRGDRKAVVMIKKPLFPKISYGL